MEKRGQFTFYRSYYEAVRDLEEAVQRKVLMAILAYGLDSREPEDLGAVESALFTLIRPTLDAGRKKAGAGHLGGKAKRKQNPREKENEKEKEMEKENETEIENEKESFIFPPPGEGGFDIFWKKYPVKIDKQKAKAIYLTLLPEETAILDGLERWLQCSQWQREGGRFIPRPAKFLQEKHYLQAPARTVVRGASGVLGQAEVEAIENMMGGKYHGL